MMQTLTRNVIKVIEGRDADSYNFMVGANLIIRESCRRL